MEKSLSDTDIKVFIPNVVLYEQLKGLTPKQLIAKMPCAILYQETPNRGHWTLLHQTPEGIEFFDPYGIIIDQEFKELKWKQPHYLAKKLYKLSKYHQINYNQYKFQAREKGINTCGRWTILRQLFSNMPIDIFGNMIVKACNTLDCSPDELAVMAFNS